MGDLDQLQRELRYSFGNINLLELALTHRSVSTRNYERLEFLGDSVLGFVVAENLFRRFTDASEGELSRTRSSIVKQPTLAKVARSLSLGDYLGLGGGELKSGGFNRDSILADAVEAILGAVYLDGGLDPARNFVNLHFTDQLDEANPEKIVKDPKTRLQEYLQKNGKELPVYNVVGTSGASHDQCFEVRCTLPLDGSAFIGWGGSKRKAEQAAADSALGMLSKQDTTL